MRYILKIGAFIISVYMICVSNMSFAVETGWETTEEKVSRVDNIKPKDNQEDMRGGSTFIGGDSGKLKGILTPPNPGDFDTSLEYALRLIQIIINRLLGILGFLSLIYMLYCGFQIMSSGTEDGSAKKGKAGIKKSAFALAGIGLSWVIISAMIWFVENITKIE